MPAPIDPATAMFYLGAEGSFVDVYRFKYTITNANYSRLIAIVAEGVSAEVAGSVELVNGVWQPVYTVQFNARELWGESGHIHDSVSIDLWEEYLE